MSTRSRRGFPWLLLLLPAALGAQDAPALQSGPVPGTPLAKCRVYAPSGPFAGQEFDAAERIGRGPGVLLFVHDLSRNTAPLITGLDRLALQLAWTGLETHTVRIGAERSEAEIAVKRSSDALQLYRPIEVTVDGVEGPGGYALLRSALLTLVTCKDGKVVRSVGFTDTGRADLGKLRSLVEEVTGPIPTDPAELRQRIAAGLPDDTAKLRALVADLVLALQRVDRAEQNRMQRQQRGADAPAEPGQRAEPARKREGKAPEDDELRGLLRRAIQKGADAAELDAVFAAVDARVASDAGLAQQAVEMWKLMLSLDYGNDDAKGRAKAWLEKHAK